MKKIAIYGKGGIGKSTISSNLSACMATTGLRVMQIGCDPKHDSTQMLCGNIATLLDSLQKKGDNVLCDEIVKTGVLGIKCIEIGGPKPGVGCAGRGIIKGIDWINKEKVLENNNIDICLYDVLGDVVCGGFFEPIRRGGTEEIYIVTSGEFNSLFAANNICIGFNNSVSSAMNVHIGGIIGNLRGIPNEKNVLIEFSKHLNVPIVGIVPRDNKIEYTTNHSSPLVVLDKNDSLTKVFFDMVEKIMTSKERYSRPNTYDFEELKKMQQELTSC